jgi:filamentous hemagglutinin family protein
VKKKILSFLAIASLQVCGISGFPTGFFKSNPASAQPIIPANDLGTNVTQQGGQFNIGGGTQAGANLFHSFQQFGLNQGQIANFLSNPNIQNILSRVVGGDPSVINGVIQLTGGNSNLYIMNPAGIIFGANASLNVPAAFTATTANGIQVGSGWFGINTSTDVVKTLAGTPSGFAFANPSTLTGASSSGGAIVNAGNLTVQSGRSIVLVGGLVINTGTIASPTGKITIAAVENGKFVRISQAGSLLSLDLPVADNQQLTANSKPIQITDLPSLLAGRPDIVAATGLSVNPSGQVVLPNNVAIPTQTGTAIASGNLNVSGSSGQGGTVHVLGTNVGLVGVKINASGTTGGGTVLIGGDYQGKGSIPNAQFTYVSPDSAIIADALHSGNGGKVIIWSDQTTSFNGDITAKGGATTGDGGFVEVSGKENLLFQGRVYTSSTNGKSGTLLLDPSSLTIGGAVDNPNTIGGFVQGQGGLLDFNDLNPAGVTISTATLQALTTSNIILRTNGDITFSSPGLTLDNAVQSLTLSAANDINFISAGNPFITGGGLTTVTLIAGRDINLANTVASLILPNASITAGRNFVMSNPTAQTLNTQNLSINASSITTGKLSILNGSATLTAQGNISIQPLPVSFFNSSLAVTNGTVSITSSNGNINTGTINVSNGDTGNGNVSLIAPNGIVTLNGFIKAGDAGSAAGFPLADSKITITAQSFLATNPLTNQGNFINGGDTTSAFNNGQANPISLIAYSAVTPDPANGSTFTGVPTRSVQLTLPGDTSARTIAGSGAPIISITILKDTSFTIFPRPVPVGGSGTNGGITQGVSSIPPNVFVLISDQSFTSNPVFTNASTAVLVTTPTDGAVTAARTAEVQTASNNLATCDSEKDKKPALNVTASLPTPSTGGIDRGANSGARDGKRDVAGLPPCK